LHRYNQVLSLFKLNIKLPVKTTIITTPLIIKTKQTTAEARNDTEIQEFEGYQ